ncbi:MAG: hypothetical protein IJW24_01660 [Clostridia bacterium]|nr:hypothetical protein [Clostridia bacterium]
MTILEYCFIGLFVAIVLIASIVTIVTVVKEKKAKNKNKQKEVNTVEEIGGVRYTPDANIVDDNGEMQVSYVKEDIVLQPRKMVAVGKKSPIKPGKYTVLAAYSNEDTFNIRIGGFVKEYKHGQEVVLAEGDEICPTSTTIILR